MAVKDKVTERTITFSIPQKCPLESKLSCDKGKVSDVEDEEALVSSPKQMAVSNKVYVSTSTLLKKRKLSKPLWWLRRSEGVKG
jgi:hypothetical protein